MPTAEDHRLADRRREVGDQPDPHDGGTCERLVAAGLPLWRVGVFVRTLHPDIFGRNFIWRPGAEVVVGSADYDILNSQEFQDQPAGDRVSARAARSDAGSTIPRAERFPFFDDLRAEGVTDYIALPLLFIDGSVHASSWTTKQPGGFTDEQLTALRIDRAAAGAA